MVRDVDTRRLVPRTDQVLADPRLAAAERRLGRALVKAAVSRAQRRARDGQIAPDEVADAAVADLPAHAAALTPVINATGVLVHTNPARRNLSTDYSGGRLTPSPTTWGRFAAHADHDPKERGIESTIWRPLS
jgi:hypothetical protein